MKYPFFGLAKMTPNVKHTGADYRGKVEKVLKVFSQFLHQFQGYGSDLSKIGYIISDQGASMFWQFTC